MLRCACVVSFCCRTGGGKMRGPCGGRPRQPCVWQSLPFATLFLTDRVRCGSVSCCCLVAVCGAAVFLCCFLRCDSVSPGNTRPCAVRRFFLFCFRGLFLCAPCSAASCLPPQLYLLLNLGATQPLASFGVPPSPSSKWTPLWPPNPTLCCAPRCLTIKAGRASSLKLCHPYQQACSSVPPAALLSSAYCAGRRRPRQAYPSWGPGGRGPQAAPNCQRSRLFLYLVLDLL